MCLIVSSNTFKFRHDFLPVKVEHLGTFKVIFQLTGEALPHHEGWGHSLSSLFQGHHL